jgi:hypothetical protein
MKGKPVKLVMLDGTYPCASRQLKHIAGACKIRKIPIPVVKLDLTDGFCKSAIAGIMSQPGKEKICTYQALVMAMRQVGTESHFCDELFLELEYWLIHILKQKVKLGKNPHAVHRRVVDGVDSTPESYLEHLIVSILL